MAIVGGLGLALAVSSLLAVSLGAVYIPLPRILGILLARIPGLPLPSRWTGEEEAIILLIRLPRVVAAGLVGAALANAGVLFQGLLRNPMADPYIIGTSGGAALGATLAMFLPWHRSWYGFGMVSVCAFFGALASVSLVYNLARVGPRTPVTTLLLSGFAVGSMLTAVMSFLMMMSRQNLHRIVIWLMGGVTAGNWRQIMVLAPLVIWASMASLLFALDLNALLLGEEGAAYVGVEVERRKALVLALGSFLTASAVSASGLVGFVGLVVPHVARLIFGPDHRLLLPAATLLGATFLVLADLTARIALAPAELPVGVITALVGGPFFLYLLRRSKKEYVF